MGNPNIIIKNHRGLEVWTYTRQIFNPEEGTIGENIMLYGKKQFEQSPTNAYDLLLEWHKSGQLRDYDLVATQYWSATKSLLAELF